MNVLDKIEKRIAEVREELSRLETARHVLTELYGKESAPAGTNGAGHNGAAFTIKRVAAPVESKQPATRPKPTKADREKRVAQKAKVREKVIARLKKAPTNSAQIMVDIGEPKGSQLVYQILYDLKQKGTVQQSAEGVYSLRPQ